MQHARIRFSNYITHKLAEQMLLGIIKTENIQCEFLRQKVSYTRTENPSALTIGPKK